MRKKHIRISILLALVFCFTALTPAYAGGLYNGEIIDENGQTIKKIVEPEQTEQYNDVENTEDTENTEDVNNTDATQTTKEAVEVQENPVPTIEPESDDAESFNKNDLKGAKPDSSPIKDRLVKSATITGIIILVVIVLVIIFYKFYIAPRNKINKYRKDNEE